MDNLNHHEIEFLNELVKVSPSIEVWAKNLMLEENYSIEQVKDRLRRLVAISNRH